MNEKLSLAFSEIKNGFNKNNLISIPDEEIEILMKSKHFIHVSLNKKEIIQNWINLKEIINIEEECARSPSNICPGKMNHHLAIKRYNDRIYFYYFPCEKITKIIEDNLFKNKYIFNYYSNSEASDVLFSSHFNNKSLDISFIKTSQVFINNFKNDVPFNAYMYGKCGIGKTFFTFAITNAYAKKKNKSICFIYVPEFVNLIKSSFNDQSYKDKVNKIFNAAKMAEVLVFDDIGSEYATDWFYSNYFLNILNIRQSQKSMITIFNSNFSINELHKVILSRCKQNDKETMCNRIFDRINYIIGKNEFYLKGPNLRKK